MDPPTVENPDYEQTPRENRNAHRAQGRAERKQRLGKAPEVNLDDATDSMGTRDQEPDDLREAGDLAGNMRDYNRSLVALLREMQQIMQQGIADMAEIQARFRRM